MNADNAPTPLQHESATTRAVALPVGPFSPLTLNPDAQLMRGATRVAVFESTLEDRGASLREYLRALHPEHWLKNLLTFVPIFTTHLFVEPVLLARTLLAFVAFCCCSSSGDLINDLCELRADRRHPEEHLRPFACRRVPLGYGLVMALALAFFGSVLARLLSMASLGIVLLYLTLTVAYPFYLKKVVLLDVLLVAALYTLRIVGGGVAIAIWPSVWLVASAMFLFVSLALMKRYGELVRTRRVESDHETARVYKLADAELLTSKGIASGYAAVLMLALYIASGAVKTLYATQQVLWFVCPLLVYWIGYLWLIAHRGEMQHDPMEFAVRNRTSRILILLMLLAAFIAI